MFKEVKSIPIQKHGENVYLDGITRDFVNGDADMVVLDHEGNPYITMGRLSNCIRLYAKRHNLPMKVVLRDDEVYLIKKGDNE